MAKRWCRSLNPTIESTSLDDGEPRSDEASDNLAEAVTVIRKTHSESGLGPHTA